VWSVARGQTIERAFVDSCAAISAALCSDAAAICSGRDLAREAEPILELLRADLRVSVACLLANEGGESVGGPTTLQSWIRLDSTRFPTGALAVAWRSQASRRPGRNKPDGTEGVYHLAAGRLRRRATRSMSTATAGSRCAVCVPWPLARSQRIRYAPRLMPPPRGIAA
jgi:hypothetical protein